MSKNVNYYKMVNDIMETDTNSLTAQDIYREYFLGKCLPIIIKRRLASVCNPTIDETVFPEMERLYMLYGVEIRPLKDRSPLVKIVEGKESIDSPMILYVNRKYYKELLALISDFNNKYNLGNIEKLTYDDGISFSPSYGFLDFVDCYNQEVYSIFGENCDEYTINLEKEKNKIREYAEALFSDKIDSTVLNVFLDEILSEFIKDDLVKLSSGEIEDENTPTLHLLGFDRTNRADWSSGYYNNFGVKTYLINGDVSFQNTIKTLIRNILDAYDIHYSRSYSELRINASITQLLEMYYMEKQRLDHYNENKNEGKTFVKKS